MSVVLAGTEVTGNRALGSTYIFSLFITQSEIYIRCTHSDLQLSPTSEVLTKEVYFLLFPFIFYLSYLP